jgi:hypothetical protein
MTVQEAIKLEVPPAPAESDVRAPIYLQDWWWRVASSGRQRIVSVVDSRGEVGRLSYFFRLRSVMGIGKLKYGVHAPWTNYCAPIINQDAGHVGSARRGEIAYELARQLPRGMSYQLTFPHYTEPEVIAGFQRADFGVATQKSYILDLRGATEAKVVAQLDMSTRQRLRKAQKKLVVAEITPGTFFDLYRQDLASRSKISYADLDIAERLAAICQSRRPACIRITAARIVSDDCDAPYQAAIACLQDNAFSYYWMSTRNINAADPDVRNGAVKLLIVDAIAHAARCGLIFDFDGAATQGTGELYRGFRSVEVDRYVLTRNSVPVRIINAVRPVIFAITRGGTLSKRAAVPRVQS